MVMKAMMCEHLVCNSALTCSASSLSPAAMYSIFSSSSWFFMLDATTLSDESRADVTSNSEDSEVTCSSKPLFCSLILLLALCCCSRAVCALARSVWTASTYTHAEVVSYLSIRHQSSNDSDALLAPRGERGHICCACHSRCPCMLLRAL
jgi:hypothetical protein